MMRHGLATVRQNPDFDNHNSTKISTFVK